MHAAKLLIWPQLHNVKLTWAYIIVHTLQYAHLSGKDDLTFKTYSFFGTIAFFIR